MWLLLLLSLLLAAVVAAATGAANVAVAVALADTVVVDVAAAVDMSMYICSRALAHPYRQRLRRRLDSGGGGDVGGEQVGRLFVGVVVL